jgi:hypothetical protein
VPITVLAIRQRRPLIRVGPFPRGHDGTYQLARDIRPIEVYAPSVLACVRLQPTWAREIGWRTTAKVV